MIIQCEQCRTKFKLDNSKVPDKGVKVRCAKCRSVFSVFKEQSEEAPRTNFESILDSTVSSEQGTVEVPAELTAIDQVSEIEFEETSPEQDALPEHADLIETAPFEMEEDQETLFSTDENSTIQGLFTPIEASVHPPVQTEPPDSISDVDFGEFDFGNDEEDATADVPQTLDFGVTPKIQPAQTESQANEFGGLDFSDDDMFGEVVPSTPEEPTEAISFDFGMDAFSASMGLDNTSASQKNAFTMAGASSDSPFSMDDIDFGDELTSVGVQHVNPDKLQPSQELLFAPLAEAQAKPVSYTDKEIAKEELPPLSIASRRKQSPLFTALFATLGIIIAVIAIFYGYSKLAGDKTDTALESDRISIAGVDAKFVKNKSAGNLLVISGEAVNDFKKPRAAIQIKGMVYGADGEVLASKTAFCGNPLTDEQLSTMSLEKIEAAMANQFGDSLANMEVAPGKAIPFVIVIAKPPADAKDYGVDSAGSTVATGK